MCFLSAKHDNSQMHTQSFRLNENHENELMCQKWETGYDQHQNVKVNTIFCNLKKCLNAVERETSVPSATKIWIVKFCHRVNKGNTHTYIQSKMSAMSIQGLLARFVKGLTSKNCR